MVVEMNVSRSLRYWIRSGGSAKFMVPWEGLGGIVNFGLR